MDATTPAPALPKSDRGHDLLTELEKVIVGQRSVLEIVLATVLSHNHVLLEDLPGVGKTVLAQALSNVLGLEFSRIQGTTDLLPTDVTGVHVYNPADSSWNFRKGPIFSSLVLVDELNRATPKAQSALLEAMAEAQVTADGETMPLPRPFVVIATQNPQKEAGTYPLVAAQLDRFATLVRMGLPGRDAEKSILQGAAGTTRLSELQPVLSHDELMQLHQEIQAVRCSETTINYILDLVDLFRSVDNHSVWLSVRVPQTILEIAKALARLDNRAYVTPADVQKAAPSIIEHRLPRNFDHETIIGIMNSATVPVDVP